MSITLERVLGGRSTAIGLAGVAVLAAAVGASAWLPAGIACAATVALLHRERLAQARFRRAEEEAGRALRDLVNSIDAAVLVLDADERLVLANAAASKSFRESLPAATAPTLEELLTRAAETGELVEQVDEALERIRTARRSGDEIEMRFADGRALRGRLRPTVDGAGWVGTWTDASETRVRETEARESEERYRALSEAASEGIVFCDDGVVLDANRAAVEMFGLSIDEVRGRHLEEFLGPEHRGVVRERRIARRVDRGVYRAYRGDGREIWIEAENRFITRRGREITLTCFRDVTEHRRSEEALRAAKEAAERADAAKTDFVRMVGHEIRNPLNGLLGMLRLMRDDEPSHPRRARVETAIVSGEAMIEILNDLLDIARIEAGALTLESRPIDIVRTVEEALELLAPQAAARGLRLAGAVTFDMPARPRGDAGRLRQILINLVSNALKCTRTGGIAVVVEAVARADVPPGRFELRIVVEDSGVGIAPEAIPGLFRPFNRLGREDEGDSAGTGLGLTITRRLAELMGGGVSVESEVGRGSRFTVRTILETGDVIRAAVGAPLDGLRVAVVDPCPLTAAARRIPLESAGASVVAEIDDADAILLAGSLPEGTVVPSGVRVVEACEPDGTPRSRDRTIALLTGAAAEVDQPALSPPTKAAHAGARILIVEDGATNRDVAQAYLLALGHAPSTARNGREAVEIARRETPDLILMDLTLPEMDGIAAAVAIRAEPPPLGEVPIVAVTADASEETRARCLEAGMNDHLSKPIDPDELARRIRRLLAPPVFDPAPIDRLTADLGRETAIRMLRECLRENATRAARLADPTLDIATATREAHTLKSTAAAFGLRALEATAREAEAAARAGDAARLRPLADAAPALAREAEKRLRDEGRLEP